MHIELGVVALTCRHLQTSFTRSSGCVCPALWGLGLMDGPGRRTGVLSFMLQQQSSSLKEQGDHSLLLQGTILLSTPRKVLFSLFALSFNSHSFSPSNFQDCPWLCSWSLPSSSHLWCSKVRTNFLAKTTHTPLRFHTRFLETLWEMKTQCSSFYFLSSSLAATRNVTCCLGDNILKGL